jgi:CRISPR-associated endonuclease/helicase Cas3
LLENYAPEHPALLGNWREVFTLMNCETDLQATTDAVPSIVTSVLECTEESFDLLVYLIAAHHGKVRATIQASPKDQEYRDNDGLGFPIRGVREGDRVPSLKIGHSMELIPELLLTLSPAALGLSTRTGASWRERCLGLLDRHGPTALAYLEAVFRAADVRASKLKTEDSAMLKEVNV